MARLIYSTIASLDGYVADEEGNFDWAAPDEQLHQYVNDLERSVGTYLYGRRMYEVMSYWETAETAPAGSAASTVTQDFASVWQAADKVVYSHTLEQVHTARTRLERQFQPDAVRRLKESAAADISVGGPGLAAAALSSGLVDECNLFLVPAVVGGGTKAFSDGLRLGLELREEFRFSNGAVHLRYVCR
ncbi:dihydrofolate reductase [Jatrophihabitans sp. GAS493]|uniref:dihydrofolate reductase family protein n=1 Tax=Jatrophihabitans sp. GAS493 TaxID=1907575 RepID=UPI000BB9693F|nr:dihydrofolate reductase family protein [Jatrophihabitans sp. GAS493]SOD73944.1 dihydrofolate reductase [Jatrophihabitans sp. GAS493]